MERTTSKRIKSISSTSRRHSYDRTTGNLNANPLTLALLGMSAYSFVHCTLDRITLRQITSRRRYSGPMPAVLVDYIAGFGRGARIFKSHEFELVVEIESK